MPRAGLSTAAVVDAALDVVDQQGIEGLTLAAVAGRTGVAPPSLYKHVRSLSELRTLVGERVLNEMADRFIAVVIGYSGDDAVTALMHAYRAYVGEHPRRYAAVPFDPLHSEALVEAGQRVLNVCLAVLRGYGMSDSAAVHATRCLRALAHGFVSIETNGGFGLPEDLDETYDQAIQMFLASLPRP
ncbi:TetR/AcrR family transcriptional regulator [Phytoactinopolyspora alkaliphila]|uniref:TetR/AcrR family transcriptional regulator n=1 Tax=Phytoactinopolyspora alkaliphila TaxID=1783498 RepID=A0A6N9YKU3_9ACTN|nr:TetR/AcrR family transcriptional regulator [Phytoactinopolyspora alkaliphila]NED95691.1 TetR/AcrR family transcriptional regulator [Phytoactinopolyspora alkaliphila]